MFNLDRAVLEEASSRTGFIRDNLEKVYRLADILSFINESDYLSSRLALKGGTAINLTVFDLPRLSVDIDLDYSVEASREKMLEEREEIENIITRYMNASGYSVDSDRGKAVHSLGSWAFSYTNSGGNRDNIKVEINYSMRNHVLPLERRNVTIDFIGQSFDVTRLATQELFGSKIKALIERTAARDLYDIHNMIKENVIADEDRALLRKIVLFYLTVGSTGEFKEDIKLDAIDNLTFTKVRQTLLPVLRKSVYVDLDGMKQDVKDYLSKLLVFTNEEKDYVNNFRKGRYIPELLFDDEEIIKRIKNHPMALWKARNIAD